MPMKHNIQYEIMEGMSPFLEMSPNKKKKMISESGQILNEEVPYLYKPPMSLPWQTNLNAKKSRIRGASQGT